MTSKTLCRLVKFCHYYSRVGYLKNARSALVTTTTVTAEFMRITIKSGEFNYWCKLISGRDEQLTNIMYHLLFQ